MVGVDHTMRNRGRMEAEGNLDTQGEETEVDIRHMLVALPWDTQFGVDRPLDTAPVGEAGPSGQVQVGV